MSSECIHTAAHLVLTGPSFAGKTTLMSGLVEAGCGDFTVDRTWTTRKRRPGEDDSENVFVTPKIFDNHRGNFLFTFQSHPDYEYGITKPVPLREKEIRMRILMPVHTRLFRELIGEPVVVCAIAPFEANPGAAMLRRDPGMKENDLQGRLDRFRQDQEDAGTVADVHFRNAEGIDSAVRELGGLVIRALAAGSV